jgi:hypothetical protein
VRHVDERQRAGIAIIMLVYVVGYIVGRAGGRVDCARELLRAHGSRPSRA